MARTYKERQQVFLRKLQEIHGNYYDTSKVDYINAKTNITLVCPIHGDFYIAPTNIISLGRGCQKCALDDRIGRPKKVKDLESFITVARKVHGNTYDYSKTVYIKALEKVIITCQEHGDFLQTPAAHYSGSGCPTCGDAKRITSLTRSTKEYVAKVKEVHGDTYDYSKTIYTTGKEPITVTCKTHGDFYIKPIYHITGSGCSVCSSSIAERLIANILTKNNIAFSTEKTFSDLRGLSGGLLRFDFYLPEFNIVIEYQGQQHYWSVFGSDVDKQKAHDKLKKDYCVAHNIPLIEIPYWERSNIANILNQRIGTK